MAKYSWATDIHLDFLANRPADIAAFAESLIKPNPDGILISGDISVAKNVVLHLSMVESVVQRPIYYVLGNHDYYGGSIEQVRKTMRELTNVSPFLRYMPTMPYIALTPATALIGHDGWYDAFNGDWKNSSFTMLDWSAIDVFRNVQNNKATIVAVARKLANEGVTHVHDAIKKAVKYHKNIVILTHVPPFKESHIYNGAVGDDSAQPWFTSKMMGDMLLGASQAFPTHTFTVLSGHTHGKYSGKVRDNLIVNVGDAEYYQPRLQGVVEVP